MDARKVVALRLSLEKKEMSDHLVSEELLEDRRVTVTDGTFEILDELLEHLTEDLELNVAVRREHVLSNGLVSWEHTLESWRVVARKNSGSLLELSLADVLASKLSQELVEDLLVLLLSNLEALFPSAFLSKELETGQIATFNDLGDLVAGNVRLFFGLLNLLNVDLRVLNWSNLLCAVHSSIPFLDLKVSVDGSIVHKD